MTTKLAHLLLCSAVACGLGFSPWVLARDILPEDTLKVGYLYNFSLLTTWPADARGNSFEICSYGNKEFGIALNAIQGKLIDNRPINVRHMNDLNDVSKCHLLFLSSLPPAALSSIIQHTATRPVLTVTDDQALAKAGVIIFLRPEGKRLVFEINVNKAKSVSLDISSRLLRLARSEDDK